MRNLSRLARTVRRATAFGALGATTLVTATAAQAASPWQFEGFRWAGGSRVTITVSKQQQLPGVDPTIWPKGYRFICKVEAPLIRLRVNYGDYGDVAFLESRLQYAKAGNPFFTKLGSPQGNNFYTAPGSTPRTDQYSPQPESMIAGRDPAKAILSPALGLYEMQVIPMSEYRVLPPYNLYLPAATLNGKLDIRQGSATECPTPTSRPFAFFRASV